jgi:group I intron endonuclease
MTIYKVTNKQNGLIYIGQTKHDGATRFSTHVREALSVKRKNYGLFHNAIVEFGKNSFEVEDLETELSEEEANERERYWIEFYKSNDCRFGYNVDSGGMSGGKKGASCRQQMSESTKRLWQNEEKAQIMRCALQRGVDTMKKNAKRYEWKCPICGKVLLLEGYDARKRKFCSVECSRSGDQWKNGVESAALLIHERNVKRKEIIKKDIYNWCLQNSDIVLNCPKNRITSTLKGLRELVDKKYSIKDIRSLFVCFDVKNKREFLEALKAYIS